MERGIKSSIDPCERASPGKFSSKYNIEVFYLSQHIPTILPTWIYLVRFARKFSKKSKEILTMNDRPVHGTLYFTWSDKHFATFFLGSYF